MAWPRVVFVDMDDTIADFSGVPHFGGKAPTPQNCVVMYKPGFFRNLRPIPGALVGVRALVAAGFDVQICTQPVAQSAHCYQEKAAWIARWFPELVGKVNMVQDKGLLIGDYLIDDNAEKWKRKFQGACGGTFIHFQYWDETTGEKNNHELQWKKVVEQIIAHEAVEEDF